MCGVPFLDWNGNGKVDPQDIALTLAIAESDEAEDNEEDDEEQSRFFAGGIV